ncbi:hypothetical protein PENTCL1PPCAC_3686, partial [Pristionchus entomophagus]
QIIPGGLSKPACQVICMDNPQCTAIQLTTTGNCVIFGGIVSATYGQCPAPFTCMLKTNTGCAPKPRRPIDLGYIAHYCSGAVQQAPIDNGTVLPCGGHSPGNRTVYIDALMHDGTNQVLENAGDAGMHWDDGIGSWYMIFSASTGTVAHYFLAAKCVRPRAIPVPECECEQIPLYTTANRPTVATPPLFAAIACPSSNIRTYCLNLRRESYFTANKGRLYCANKVWMQV